MAFGGWLGQKLADVDDAVHHVVNGVGDIATNVVQGIQDDPIKAALMIAATATGNSWAVPIIQGADTLDEGGDLGDALEAGAKAYITQQAAGAAGNYAASATASDAATAADAAGAAPVKDWWTPVIKGAAQGATSGAINGGSLEAAIKGAITGGTSSAAMDTLKGTDWYKTLDDKTLQGIAQAALKMGIGGVNSALISELDLGPEKSTGSTGTSSVPSPDAAIASALTAALAGSAAAPEIFYGGMDYADLYGNPFASVPREKDSEDNASRTKMALGGAVHPSLDLDTWDDFYRATR